MGVHERSTLLLALLSTCVSRTPPSETKRLPQNFSLARCVIETDTFKSVAAFSRPCFKLLASSGHGYMNQNLTKAANASAIMGNAMPAT